MAESIAINYSDKDVLTFKQLNKEMGLAMAQFEKMSASVRKMSAEYEKSSRLGRPPAASYPSDAMSEKYPRVTAADMEAESQRAARNREAVRQWSDKLGKYIEEKRKELAKKGLAELKEYSQGGPELSKQLEGLSEDLAPRLEKAASELAKGNELPLDDLSKSMTKHFGDIAKEQLSRTAAGMLGAGYNAKYDEELTGQDTDKRSFGAAAWDYLGEQGDEWGEQGLVWAKESAEDLEKWGEQAMDVSDEIKQLGEQTMTQFGQVLKTVAAGGKADFKAMADSIIDDLKRIAIQMAVGWVVKTLGSYFGGMMSGGGTGGATDTGGANGGGSLPAGQYYAAHGLAFDRSGLIAFAKGGVVTKPTTFAFAQGVGVMGEAGPEAIMPLKRGTDGKLGVAAQGNAQPTVNVVVENHSGQPVQQRQSTGSFGEKEIRVIIGQAVADQIYNGGPVRQALEGRYQIPKRM